MGQQVIVIKMELWRGGDPTQVRTLGEIRIINDGSGTAEVGNYKVEASHAGMYYRPGGKPWKTGRVIGFARRLSPYRLLCRALKAIYET